MLWLKLIGWILFIIPILGFGGFTAFMIKETMPEDEHIAGFVMLMGALFLIGGGILVLTYFTDFIGNK